MKQIKILVLMTTILIPKLTFSMENYQEKIIPVGTEITINDLDSDTGLNGCNGYILSYNESNQMYQIRLPELNKIISVQNENIYVCLNFNADGTITTKTQVREQSSEIQVLSAFFCVFGPFFVGFFNKKDCN